MTDDVIVKNEVMNDGGTVHLYYSNAYKGYVAYGYSAFIASVVVPKMKDKSSHCSYSKVMQMPYIIVGEDHLRLLQSRLDTVKASNGYICLHGIPVLDEKKYEEWASFLRGE